MVSAAFLQLLHSFSVMGDRIGNKRGMAPKSKQDHVKINIPSGHMPKQNMVTMMMKLAEKEEEQKEKKRKKKMKMMKMMTRTMRMMRMRVKMIMTRVMVIKHW